ncbi:hypothetical protein SADUNF_Sadunf16G0142800 [Salix dunnii]|uniref:THUMP domain-containing protein n=1 Tax=Salix dunnii TaxID=1413687 RepID=A0A835JB50_9ROSI|nr:hypothetical protein SADUNF_Sadunf16G0142800 [Salix dunnii]
MPAENKPKSSANVTTNSKKRKQRYLPHNVFFFVFTFSVFADMYEHMLCSFLLIVPVTAEASEEEGFLPITPRSSRLLYHLRNRKLIHAVTNALGGFGREICFMFYEELVLGKDSGVNLAELLDKPINKKIKFSYSDDEGDNDEDKEEDEEDGLDENKTGASEASDAKNENPADEKLGSPCLENENSECQTEEKTTNQEGCKNDKRQESEAEELPAKKKCTETCAPKSVALEKVEEKSIDKLIEDELKELGDKNKRRFLSLDSGCNGIIFVQMRKIDGDPCPKDIVQHMMTSAASTRKHISRFILRVLPIEVACYASEEEISRAIAPVVEKYFPVDTQDPQKGICPLEKEAQIIESQKVDFGPSHLVQDTISLGVAAEFAVMYEARANSGIDRMKIINSVAKSVPGPHKVDLSNPDKTIVVEIVKYKELSKYNLRQLSSSEQQ